MENLNINKNVFFAVASFIFNALLLLVSIRLIVKYHGLEVFGIWSLLVAWTSFARIGDFGLGFSVIRVVSGMSKTLQQKEISSILTTSFYFILCLSAVIALSAGVMIYLFKNSLFSNHDLGNFFYLVPILLQLSILSALTSFQSNIIQSFHEGYVGSILLCFANLIQFAVIFLFAEKYSIWSLAGAQLLSQGFLFVAYFIVIGGIGPFSFLQPKLFDRKVLAELFSFGTKIQILNIINGYIEPLAKVLFGFLGDLASQALFEIAYKIITVLRNAIVSGVTAIFPALSYLIKNDFNELRRRYSVYKNRLFWAIMGAGFCMIVFTPLLSILILREIDYDLFSMVLILSVGYYFNSLSSLSYITALGLGVLKYNIVAAASALLAMPIVFFLVAFLPIELRVVCSVAVVLSFCSIFLTWKNECLLQL